MKHRVLYKNLGLLILTGLTQISLIQSAYAQIRVDARIQTSFGSCSGCDLSKRRMNGMKMQDSDFSKSLFNSSNLSGARFDRANLSEAHFRKALLLRVVGKNVNMSNASFREATLTEAALNNSNLTGTDFRRADLTRSTFDTTNFSDANLMSASAQDANFSNSIFVGARLDHVNLQQANLTGGQFQNVKFGNAILRDAQITGANLSGADLSQAQGLNQTQLDTACGNGDTRLPFGMSLPYCLPVQPSAGHESAGHDHLDPKMARAAQDLDDAIDTLEKIMANPPSSEKKLRRKLQSIHADIMSSRKALERQSR